MSITSPPIPQPPLDYRKLCIFLYFFSCFHSLLLSHSVSPSLCLSMSFSIFSSMSFLSLSFSLSLYFLFSPLLFSFLLCLLLSLFFSILILSQVGFRVEHPQELINKIQFGDFGELCERGKGKVPLNNEHTLLSFLVMSCHVLSCLAISYSYILNR